MVHSILDTGALKGRTLVNFSGGSPQQARTMATWAASHGIDYPDGVIVATPEAIGGPEAALFYSGPGDAFDAALQDMLWTSMSGVAHMFALAGAENIDAADIAGHAKSDARVLPGHDRPARRADHRRPLPR